jgi:hypothetical protein
MHELTVPTVPLQVEIETVDGWRRRGRIFVPASTARHEGPERPGEFMNGPVPFFAFLIDGEEPACLLSKHTVVCLTVPAGSDLEDSADLARPHYVTVVVAGREVSGLLPIDMPAERSRVIDVLNGPEDFLRLVAGEVHHLVRKTAIVRLVEARVLD